MHYFFLDFVNIRVYKGKGADRSYSCAIFDISVALYKRLTLHSHRYILEIIMNNVSDEKIEPIVVLLRYNIR